MVPLPISILLLSLTIVPSLSLPILNRPTMDIFTRELQPEGGDEILPRAEYSDAQIMQPAPAAPAVPAAQDAAAAAAHATIPLPGDVTEHAGGIGEDNASHRPEPAIQPSKASGSKRKARDTTSQEPATQQRKKMNTEVTGKGLVGDSWEAREALRKAKLAEEKIWLEEERRTKEQTAIEERDKRREAKKLAHDEEVEKRQADRDAQRKARLAKDKIWLDAERAEMVAAKNQAKEKKAAELQARRDQAQEAKDKDREAREKQWAEYDKAKAAMIEKGNQPREPPQAGPSL